MAPHFQLTSLGDVFYQCWHYRLQEQGNSLQSTHHEPSSLMVGFELWLSEACQQERELGHYKDLPATGTLDVHPIVRYLVSSSQHLCLHCHYVHAQHYPQLELSQYFSSAPNSRYCHFCSDLLSCPLGSHQPAQTTTQTQTRASGLESLRLACAVREPQNELECSLVSGWTTSGAEIQRNLLQAADTPSLIKQDTERAAADGGTTPTHTRTRPTGKTRRIGF